MTLYEAPYLLASAVFLLWKSASLLAGTAAFFFFFKFPCDSPTWQRKWERGMLSRSFRNHEIVPLAPHMNAEEWWRCGCQEVCCLRNAPWTSPPPQKWGAHLLWHLGPCRHCCMCCISWALVGKDGFPRHRKEIYQKDTKEKKISEFSKASLCNPRKTSLMRLGGKDPELIDLCFWNSWHKMCSKQKRTSMLQSEYTAKKGKPK